MKKLTKHGVSDKDACRFLYALSGLAQDTADLYYDNYISGQGETVVGDSARAHVVNDIEGLGVFGKCRILALG